MAGRAPTKLRPWAAALIVSMFGLAVAGAAAVGWWFARESPPHQGPIVLISVDGLSASALPVYGTPRTDTPAIDSFASDAVVFEHAYAHSPQMLPAHASLLSGQLPLQHGVRDDAGFTLKDDAQTLAEMLRNRGFTTGAAVSSFLLRPETGIAQGFRFYDAELPTTDVDAAPALARSASDTLDAAETWVRMQDSRRFFLFVQVDQRDADTAVTRLEASLKSRGFYDGATIVFIGDRGEEPAQTLDDAALRIPLLVKQPSREGAGRRITAVVQQIDVVPTLLDLVRAPVPGGLPGRSLRGVLTEEDATLPERLIYSEWLAAHYRFGGHAIYALTDGAYRYVRGDDEDLLPLGPAADAVSNASVALARMRDELDRLLARGSAATPEQIAPADEERLALFGYLARPHLTDAPSPALSPAEQSQVTQQHQAAAVLIGQKKYSAGIRALQAIVNAHPDLTVVQYQLGSELVRSGRLDEAIAVLQDAKERRSDEPDIVLALADALMRARRVDEAGAQIDDAIALATSADASTRAAIHEMAARVALARNDAEGAVTHADAAHEADPATPLPQFVRGRLLYDEAKYEEAAAAFQEAVGLLKNRRQNMPDLHLYLGESLAHLDRYAEAEAQYRQELHAFPRNIQVYSRLAMLYAAARRDDAVEDVLNELVAATPTPESYAAAAKLWTVVGNRSRAEALKSDARARFRGDPSLALLGRDARR